MSRFLITLTIPPAMRQAVDAWQQEIGFITNQRLPLHVTIVPPFTTDPTSMDERRLTNLTINVPLRIKHWTTLHRDGAVILILEPDQQPLRRLVGRLIETMPPLRSHGSF